MGRRRRPAAAVVAGMLLAASCTGGQPADHGEQPPGASTAQAEPDTPLEMTPVEATPAPGAVRLRWDPVPGAAAYRISVGPGTGRDVPAGICQDEECELTVAVPAGGAGTATVAAVTARGTPSPQPAAAPYPAPDDEPGDGPDEPGDGPVEVVLLRAADSDQGPPAVETVRAGTVGEAQQIVDAAGDDPEILAASLNAPLTSAAAAAQAPDRPGEDPWVMDGLEATWQRDAMAFDLLPGDPPGSGVTVALIETGGVDISHYAYQGASVLPGARLEWMGLDGKAYQVGTGTEQPGLHATATGSLIVGQPAGQVPGVAPGATLLPVHIRGYADEMARAMIWAVEHGADVISMSLGMFDCEDGQIHTCTAYPMLQAAADYAETEGVVVVASVGNGGPGCVDPQHVNRLSLPAGLDTVISVGAYQPDGTIWPCSSRRADVDVLAPGADLLVATPGRRYAVEHGTSLATPLVSGFIAAILAERELTPAQVRQMLPNWLGTHQRLDPAAALSSVGILPPGHTVTTPHTPGGTAIYPYRIGFRFEPGHPIYESGLQIEALLGTFQGEGDINGTSVSADRGPDTKTPHHIVFGELAGSIRIAEDGTTTATGTWSNASLRSPTAMADPYGIWTFHAWGVMCDASRWPDPPPTRMITWDLPVHISAAPVSGTDHPAAVELTITFGLGAGTDRNGVVPDPDVLADNWDDCPAAIDDSRLPSGALPAYQVPWNRQGPAADAYFEHVEDMHYALVTGGPYTLTAQLGATGHTTGHTDDNRVLARYDTTPLGDTP